MTIYPDESKTRCRIGKVKYKNSNLVTFPAREFSEMEDMFAGAQHRVRQEPIVAAGYFIVTLHGRIFTEWADSDLADAAQLAGGAALLLGDVQRDLASRSKPCVT